MFLSNEFCSRLSFGMEHYLGVFVKVYVPRATVWFVSLVFVVVIRLFVFGRHFAYSRRMTLSFQSFIKSLYDIFLSALTEILYNEVHLMNLDFFEMSRFMYYSRLLWYCINAHSTDVCSWIARSVITLTVSPSLTNCTVLC